jgi:hypothetical protein
MRGRARAALFAVLAAAAPPLSSLRAKPADHAVQADQPQPAADQPAPDQSAADQPASDGPSPGAWQIINWVIASRDNNGMPFMVIDKVAAKVFVYDGDNERVGAAPVLVGMQPGDDSTPGVGDRELSHIPPKDRVTPAGRFVAKFGRAAGHRDVLWVDYPTAISLHAVITTLKQQHRLERLKSPTPDDNRITYGCINVPTKFYSQVVKPLFSGAGGIVYILPETKPLGDVFLALPPSASAVVAQAPR